MHRRNVAPLGLAFAALLGGCLADGGDGGILVLRNVVADDKCATLGSPSEPTRSHGTLDVLLGTGYTFIAQMKSRITAIAGTEDQRTIITSGANVDIAFPGSTLFTSEELTELKNLALTRFHSPFTQIIEPNGGVSDASFSLIPPPLTQRILLKLDLTEQNRIEAMATFTIEGDMSGEAVTSQPFSYAVTIGNEINVNVIGECPVARGTMPRTGYACNAAQDGIVDCCATRNANGAPDITTLRCPAVEATM
jgi:hypothetical protein